MSDKLDIHVPSFEELSYRQELLMQTSTMEYNRGYDDISIGYHKETGCIDFPESTWKKWFSFWINNKPNTYYGYILNVSKNTYVGEVNLHYNEEKAWYEIGIIIESKYRGLGYSKFALNKLLEVAFYEYHAKAVHNCFEPTRINAKRLHIKCGFSVLNDSDRNIDFIINKCDYICKVAKKN